MSKSDLPCLQSILILDKIEQDYTFVEDLVLRRNISIVMQHLIFLISIEKNHNLPGAVTFTIYKDMIIHTASIAESLLCYGLTIGLDKKHWSLKDLEIKEQKYKDPKKIFIISEAECVEAAIKVTKFKEPKETNFDQLLRAGIRVCLLTRALKDELDAIRIARNKIHLGSLSKVDDTYNQKDVDNMFKTVGRLKKRIIEYFN